MTESLSCTAFCAAERSREFLLPYEILSRLLRVGQIVMFSYALKIVKGDSTAINKNDINPNTVSEQIGHVLLSLDEVLRDDIGEAETKLATGDSSFHKLGLSLAILLRVALGSDEKVTQRASDVLHEAEKSSQNAFHFIKKNQQSSDDSMYPPGSAFALCHAQCQLMIAILATLSAKVPEAIKGFYKLRKAYMTMQTIVHADNLFRQRRSTSNVSPTDVHAQHTYAMPGGFSDSEPETGTQVPEINSEKKMTLASTGFVSSDEVFTNNSDIYIQSGTNLCFGVLLLMLSLVPPAFSLPLRIIGFRGDKEKGLHLLWQATKYANLHGAMAGLMLLSYYNAIRAVCDILDDRAYPKERCENLLVLMTRRYPHSQFWMLEEARVQVANRNLAQAINLLSRQVERPLKQVEALTILDRGFTAMFLHDYALCASDFILSVDLNNWSHTLYYYIAGCAHVEMYRRCNEKEPKAKETNRTKAREFLHLSKEAAGTQRLMAKRLPFDVFVRRKIEKWEHKATALSIDLIDAVGVSPIQEITYFYGGHRRMRQPQLEDSLSALEWSSMMSHWEDESLDERAIQTLLRANIYTTMGDLLTARTLLQDEILCHSKAAFKGPLKDDWTCPCAHYEMAVICWIEGRENGSSSTERLKECAKWLNDVSAWESYDLDARVSVKIKTARETLKNHVSTDSRS
ncbi:Mitochondrial outer membrane protein iml2 [Cadophora gregata]|uniref:Mitochondrial outer membrane protein iml2 n=1 Tax=Cadophora gregata TaxID=51156 RepID=UPI0026DA89E7|nr:Mitochondrial outer membrane protein iml2 [Cadophora gregata]KAK0107119.1 Mitochondrial outer membrane protein iml2 [Cadophora gregata]